jgi:NADH-quinone oxidoreductase subunit L
MEGPTPVSALVHSATMVAAGVFLVARFYPVLTPEVLLVIAVVGCITLFMAATIALTATDIKRVLAYSTVSQLGYMMLALGLGGWLAGGLHLFTHAFFKSLLFLCSGSVIHAVHTNELPLMGGLRKKMPWTAYTMLVGCLAIIGAGIPLVIGLSGYYSKDAIVEQALSFWNVNPAWGAFFFLAAAGAAAMTAFYMFRLWYLAFSGRPRDQHRYEHAHESPPVMYVPLVILAIFAVGVAWKPIDWNLANLLEQARPAGTAATVRATMVEMTWPDEHLVHAPENYSAIVVPATLIAFATALGGFLLATAFYGWRILDPAEVSTQFRGLYRFLKNKWWFDELYDWLFVRPALMVARGVAGFDRQWIDWLVDGSARLVKNLAYWWERIADGLVVDGFVNWLADATYRLGVSLHAIQTGRLRQYVMFIAVATVAVFVLISFFWTFTLAR